MYTAREMIGAAYRKPEDARMRPNPVSVRSAHEPEGADAAGDEQLDGQDRVDLADELVANLDGGLGHIPAKLEVIGEVVLARPRYAAGKTLGIGGLRCGGACCLVGRRSGGVIKVVIRVLRRSSRVLGVCSHCCFLRAKRGFVYRAVGTFWR